MIRQKIGILFAAALMLLLSVAQVSAQSTEQRIVFDKPIGQATAGPAGRYQAFIVHFHAQPGDRLSFVTQRTGSADSFFAPDENGIELFKNGVPQSGLLNEQVYLWDAGTTPRSTVQRVWQNSQWGQLWVWLNYLGGNEFSLRIETLSSDFALSPGVAVVHRSYAPLFRTGQQASDGLRQLAEQGSPNGLRTASTWQPAANANSGGVWSPQPVQAVTPQATAAPFSQNSSSSRVVVFGSGVEPIQPRQFIEFQMQAQPGDQLTVITSLLETNDFFFSTNEWGIALYDEYGQPRTIAATKFINMWDAGTEVNEKPREGAYQPARQPSPNSGPADPDSRVRRAHDDYGPLPIGPVEQIVNLFIRSDGNNQFTVRVRNVSGRYNLSSGVALLHRNHAPVFLTNAVDRQQGLEALAEDGNPYPLANSLRQTYR